MAWHNACKSFLRDMQGSDGLAPSVPAGEVTLYGTCYTYLARWYLESVKEHGQAVRKFALDHQDQSTGYFVGPEFDSFVAEPGKLHDREHLELHSTCLVLPTLQMIGGEIPKVVGAHRFCDLGFLGPWMDHRSLKHAWFEGNNILFAGQLLVYLRDEEGVTRANDALEYWFDWLDRNADPRTSLWGTDGHCSEMEAVYGGYHQLLVYYHEDHPVANGAGLVDTVLKLQHRDGGFNPQGNGGACEDVDCVDILVHMYKRFDYRRPEIRFALRRCLQHILSIQNDDGGFPYNRDVPQSHMGIPGTEAPPNASCAFPTWFRVHTLALIAEVIPDHPEFAGVEFQFTPQLGMGWHRSPEGWRYQQPQFGEAFQELKLSAGFRLSRRREQIRGLGWRARRRIGSLARRLGLRR